MKHIFRLNVHQKGYTLYSGQSPSFYQEYPLDMISGEISRNYIAAQRRIDAILKANTLRWHLCVANLFQTEHPVVAYGSLLPIEDDRGRTGISFVHAIETDGRTELAETVRRITQILSPQTIDEISRYLARLASGTELPQHIIDFLAAQFSRSPYKQTALVAYTGWPIKEVQHDCGGALAVAWLAMTLSHLNSAPPWEIYEIYTQQTNQISTVSSSANASAKYMLSGYLYDLIHDHGLLETLCASRSEEQASKITNVPIPLSGQEPPTQIDQGGMKKASNSTTSSNRPSEQTHQSTTETQIPEKQQKQFSSDSTIVKMDGLYGKELSLIGNTGKYRISIKNCASWTVEPDHFQFTIEQSKYLGLRTNKMRLVLLTNDLSPRQVEDLNQFCRIIGPSKDQG